MINGVDDIRDWTIYKIISPNNRVYIGVTSDFKKRSMAYRGGWAKTQPLIIRSLKKYGFDNHSVSIIETFTSNISYALGKEIFWIKSCMSNYSKYPKQRGLNLTDGGQGTVGYKMSQEQKERISKRKTGFKHTDEAKKKIGEASIGNKFGVGHKWTENKMAQMKKLMIGNKNGKGPSQNNKIAIKEAQKKRRKQVFQYDLSGNLVSRYLCVQDAAIGSNVSVHSIKAVLCGQFNKMKGFIFKYN